VEGNFVPVRVNVNKNPEIFEQFGTLWTPTTLVLDSNGVETYRVEGFLPAEDLLQELELGLGRSAFASNQWAEAERHYENLLRMFPDGHAAAEALYWLAVARYKASGDPKSLGEAAQRFKTQYSGTIWAKKAAAWGR
jgi:tetratricopeptide (TPR) repeat protein